MSRPSAKARAYLNSLVEQAGERRAQEEGHRVLGLDILRPMAPVPSQPWRKERQLDHLNRWQTTKLIDALLDIVGREGRRKNNRSGASRERDYIRRTPGR